MGRAICVQEPRPLPIPNQLTLDLLENNLNLPASLELSQKTPAKLQEIEAPIAHGLPLFLQDPRDVAPAGAPRKHNTTTAVCSF